MDNNNSKDREPSLEDLKKSYRETHKEAWKNFLKQEECKLSIEQIVTGQKMCLENAKSLIDEASLLYKNKYFSRAFFLMVSAFEELNKIPMLMGVLFQDQDDKKGWHQFWKKFRGHHYKLHGFALFSFLQESVYDLIRGTNRSTKSTEDWLKELAERPEWFYGMKLRSLYVDFIDGEFILLSNENFIEPCKKYLPVAELHLKDFETYIFKDVDDAKKFVESWKKTGLTNLGEVLKYLKTLHST